MLDSIAELEIKSQKAVDRQRSVRPVSIAIDREHIFSLLNKIEEFLEQDDTRAARALKALKEALPAGMAVEELNDLEKHIEGYAFEGAMETLAEVERTLGKLLVGDQNV